MKKNLILTAAFLFLLTTCNNHFHDLIPSDENRILSFTVENQLYDTVISDYSINVTVDGNTDITSIIPEVVISYQAAVIPITLKYIEAAFPGEDIASRAMDLYSTQNLETFLWDVIERNSDFNIPDINMPIDFTSPVNFFVISGRGSIRQYTVRVTQDTGEPRLLGIRFSKYDNPDLMSDALCHVDENAKTVYAYAKYPAEMGYASFPLIPSYEIIGDKLEVNGAEIESGADAINFNAPGAMHQTRTITIHRDGLTQNYSLVVYFEEDKDTIRSITDFRFTKNNNPNISVTAVGSIVNNDNFGTITVQVYYSGIKPDYLTASFVTPGTITVNGVPQTTGVTGNDFSTEKEYRVTSRNGLYMRTYTVRVEFINVSAASPTITSFRFSQRLNEDLVQDCIGVIGSDLIMLDVFYGSNTVPYNLVPEFNAGGIVTVSGSVQVSGASQHNYSRQVKYTVTNPENPILTRDYWVQTRFVQDHSSGANITAFGFYPEENTGLSHALEAKIDHVTGRIMIMAPTGSGIRTRLMIPRFSAAGTVKVNEVIQTSGASAQMYTWPVTYTVTSANGRNTRTYSVIVRELSSPIFVNSNAAGMNDGTNWENAFTSLKTACEAAAVFPDEMEKEIWIAKGTYKPGPTTDDYFPISPNTSYIGGFAGYETSKEQVDPELNKTIISGDVDRSGKDLSFLNRYKAVFTNDNYANRSSIVPYKYMSGNVSFENLEFRDINHHIRNGFFYTDTGWGINGSEIFYYYPIDIYYDYDSNSTGTVSVKNCNFYNVNTVCINLQSGSYNISDIYAENIACVINAQYTPEGSYNTINKIKVVDQYFDVQHRPLWPYQFVIAASSYHSVAVDITDIKIENYYIGIFMAGENTVWNLKNVKAINMTTPPNAPLADDTTSGSGVSNIIYVRNGRSLNMSNIEIEGLNYTVAHSRAITIGSLEENGISGNALLENISISNITTNSSNPYNYLVFFQNNPSLTVNNIIFNFDNRNLKFGAIRSLSGFRLVNAQFNNFNAASGNLLLIDGNYPYIIKRQGSTYNGASLTVNSVFNTVNNLTQKANGAVLTGE